MHRAFRLIALVAALLAGFFANDVLELFGSVSAPVSDNRDYCLLSSQPCEQAGVSMSLANDHAYPLVSTPITVNWPDSQAPQLLLTLEGREMDMGQVKFVLKRTAAGNYAADLLLPVCTRDGMTWVGSLTDGNKTVYPAIRMQQ